MVERYFQAVLYNFQHFFIFINHWLTIKGCIILAAIFLLILVLLKLQAPKKSAAMINHSDIDAIAGDDVMTTQLDLARAYIEMGEKTLAKEMLDQVVEQGSALQQQAAKQLLGRV